MKRCPICGLFMRRRIGFDGTDAWSGWICSNARGCWHNDHVIEAPEYDWEYSGYSDAEMGEIAARDPVAFGRLDQERRAYVTLIARRA